MKIRRITLYFIIFLIVVFILIACILLKNVIKNSNYNELGNNDISNNFSNNENIDTEQAKQENSNTDFVPNSAIYAVAFKNDNTIVGLYEDGTEKEICLADSEEYTIKDFDNNKIYLSKSNDGYTDVYRVDIKSEDSELEFITSLPFKDMDEGNDFFNNIRKFYENTFLVRDNKIYYIESKNDKKLIYEYDIENKSSDMVCQRSATYFNNSYMDKDNGYIYSSKLRKNEMNSEEGDFNIIDVSQKKSQREKQYAFDLSDEDEVLFSIGNSNKIIPVGDEIYYTYADYYNQKYGLVKLDLEEKNIEYVVDFDERMDFKFVYKDKIYFSRNGLYEYDTKNQDFIMVDEGNIYTMNIDYIINCIEFKQIMYENVWKNDQNADNQPEDSNVENEQKLLKGIDVNASNKTINKKDVPKEYTNIIYIK